mgnify:CR=1 FL=1
MHSLSLALFLSSATWALPSFPVVFQDELDSQNSNDVIGNPNEFEIDYLRLAGINGNTLQIDIRFNYGGGASLNPFDISSTFPTLRVGDLFLRTNANTYAFILNSHDGLSTNGLYQIAATQSAQTVLGNPSGSYRPAARVWADPAGAQLLSTGSSTITTVNGASTFLLATLYLPLTGNTLADLNNGFDIYFASATCGNDEITGSVPPTGVPEPGTWAMLGAGLVALGLYRRKQ